MSVRCACSNLATGCSYDRNGLLLATCSNCARSVVVWGSADAFLSEARYLAQRLLAAEIARLHRKHRRRVKRAQGLLEESRDLATWRAEIDRASSRLQARVKATIDAFAHRETKRGVLATLPLAATHREPRVVAVRARECSFDEAMAAEYAALERMRRLTGLPTATIEYDDGRTFAVSFDGSLLVIADGARTLYNESGCYTAAGPVPPGEVCAAMALLRSQGFEELESYCFHIGVRRLPAAAALWNYASSRLIVIELPAGTLGLVTVCFAAAALYLRTAHEDGAGRYLAVPAAAVYEI